VQAVKAVEIGNGVRVASSFGSEVQDEIFYEKSARRFRGRRTAQEDWKAGSRTAKTWWCADT